MEAFVFFLKYNKIFKNQIKKVCNARKMPVYNDRYCEIKLSRSQYF